MGVRLGLLVPLQLRTHCLQVSRPILSNCQSTKTLPLNPPYLLPPGANPIGVNKYIISYFWKTRLVTWRCKFCPQPYKEQPCSCYDMIYLLTAIGLSPGGSSTVHIYTQIIHRKIQNKQYIEQHNNWKSAGRAPSWLVIHWHLPYNRGKSTENLSQGSSV